MASEPAILYLVPPGGIPTWSEPTFAGPVGPRLDGGLAVEVVERRNEWGRIACSNGWSAWVDARLLMEKPPEVASTFVPPLSPLPGPPLAPFPPPAPTWTTPIPPVSAETLNAGAPVTTPAPPPSEPPAAPAPPSREWRPARLVIGLVLLITSVVVFFAARPGGHRAAAAPTIALAGADVPGPDAFTPSVAAGKPTSLASAATTIPAPTGTGPVRFNAVGDRLYAGTRGAPSCNTTELVSYLESNAARGRGWASTVGIAPTDIRAFVGALTPVLLRVDTRVTEYRFTRTGQPRPRQTVLQAGTAVLLDRSALPRVRCVSGNPLGQPATVSGTPRYDGAAWPGFRPNTTVVLTPARQTPALVLFDLQNGGVFVRLPGSVVILDLDPSVAGSVLIVVEPGGPFAVSGSRWPPGAALQIAFDNPAVPLGTATADGGGNFTITVNAPAAAPPGAHQVTITGGGFQGTQTVYVIPPAPRPA